MARTLGAFSWLQSLEASGKGVGSILKASWDILGTSWEPLGRLLGASWDPLGTSCGYLLRASWESLGSLLGPSWDLLGTSWESLGSVLGGLGGFQRRFWKHFWKISVHLKQFMKIVKNLGKPMVFH